MIRELFKDSRVRIAVMIDGKEFIKGEEIHKDNLLKLLRPKVESRVDLVRITATHNTLRPVLKIAQLVGSLGYAVAMNVMQSSLLSAEILSEIARIVEDSSVDILYFADSFGGLDPEQTRGIFEGVGKHFSRTTGFHSHDNMGLALANTLAAIQGGASILDCALLGMGRGAGNLRTEQLLLYLKAKSGYEHLNPSALFDLVSEDFSERQREFQWGMNLPYMLSGIYNVHPMYAQQLLQLRRYTSREVVRALERLHESRSAAAYSSVQLAAALRDGIGDVEEAVPVNQIKTFKADLPQCETNRSILLLGSGPSVRSRAADIDEFIRIQDPLVFECNVQAEIHCGAKHYSLFTNHKRLVQHIDTLVKGRREVILGMPHAGKDIAQMLSALSVHAYSYTVKEREFTVGEESCVIPYDVVAMFAFALALRAGAGLIFMCGFDGYRRPEDMIMEREMETFLRLFKHQNPQVRTISLTPTTYDIEQQSLYAYL